MQSQRRSTKAEIEQLKILLEDEDEKPLDMTWPENNLKKQLIYLFLAPILLLLWITLPDTRREVSVIMSLFCLTIKIYKIIRL